MRNRIARSRGNAPQRQWMELSTAWALSAVTQTTAVSLLELQSPATGVLVSDPVEDLTLLRVVGDFLVVLGTAASAAGVLALTVQDTAWTPNALFSNDADKRILWSKAYAVGLVVPAGFVSLQWTSPGLLTLDATTDLITPTGDTSMIHIDIQPDVKVRAGQALNLVWYETVAATFTTSSPNMRVLFQRSGRR